MSEVEAAGGGWRRKAQLILSSDKAEGVGSRCQVCEQGGIKFQKKRVNEDEERQTRGKAATQKDGAHSETVWNSHKTARTPRR
jgi:hypothetical protein